MNLSSRIFVVVILIVALASPTLAGGKVSLYGLRMDPDGKDAEQVSRPGWGLGIRAVVPAPQLGNFIAGVGGLDYANLLSQKAEFRDRLTGLRIEQKTSQDYIRFYIGAQVGGHGNGFVRPHAGLNIAAINYGISTELVIPDDSDRENDLTQDLGGEHHWAFGYDITIGVDLNFNNKWALDGGVRYLRSFSVPQQLGDEAVEIHPRYLQAYLGVGISFASMR